MTGIGIWKGGVVSKYIFVALFVAAMVVVLRIIPRNINAAEKAKELELQRNRLEATLEMITSGFALSLYTCTPGGASRVTVRCAAAK